MKYQVICTTEEGSITVELEERSAYHAAMTSIELLDEKHNTVLADEPVRVLVSREGTFEPVVLGPDAAESVNWLQRATGQWGGEGRNLYTVIGLYEGTDDRYATTLQDSDAAHALMLAFKEWRQRDDYYDALMIVGITEGQHRLLDCEYHGSDWCGYGEDDVDSSGAAATVGEYTVFTTTGAEHVCETSALQAERQFGRRKVAGVVAGNVTDLMPFVPAWLEDWCHDRPKVKCRRGAVVLAQK